MASQLMYYIQNHLAQVLKDPSVPLDQRLLDKFDSQIAGKKSPTQTVKRLAIKRILNFLLENLTEDERDSIFNQLSELVPNLQQDPSPVANLIDFLIRPESFTFSRVLAAKPVIDFVTGLSIPSPPLNITTLRLLDKAIINESDAGIVAGMPGLVAALIRLWLCTSETAVAQKAEQVLLGLLGVDENGKLRSEEIHPNLIWRRLSRDRAVYDSMFSICSLTTLGVEGQPSKREKTVAQARLLDLLVKIDCESIRGSQLPDVEATYSVQNGGLLKYAAVHMVDYQGDILMHIVLIEFFANLLRRRYSTSLDFLIENGLHSRTLSYYLEPEKFSQLDFNYLYGQSANYLSIYCSTFRAHVLSQPSLLSSILLRLTNALGELSEAYRERGTFKHDLRVLASLPRIFLLPKNFERTPFFHVYNKHGDAAIYSTLAAVFQGTNHRDLQHSLLSPTAADDDSGSQENSAARVLYYLYLKEYPFFWEELVQAANIIALQDVALAAIGLLKAVITAEWGSLPLHPRRDWPNLPTEKDLAAACHSSDEALPLSGFDAIFADGTWEIIVSYLLSSSPAFDNLVGGRGDTESAAYKVAVAKHDVIKLFYQKLEPIAQEKEGFHDVLKALWTRVVQGPRGGLPEVRPTIATLEL